jgi:mRNA interferase HicA
MVKQKEVVNNLSRAALRKGIEFSFLRHGGSHDIYLLGNMTVKIPRHRELKENLARLIYKEVVSELGKDWWK